MRVDVCHTLKMQWAISGDVIEFLVFRTHLDHFSSVIRSSLCLGTAHLPDALGPGTRSERPAVLQHEFLDPRIKPLAGRPAIG